MDPLQRAHGSSQSLEGVLANHESEGRRRDGSRIWTLENATLIDDPPAGSALIEGTVVDITERKLLEQQLRQAQKMEAVGQLAGGVAHDFNNLLGVISGYSDLALRQTPVDDPRRRPIEQIQKAGERAAALTRQLLAFGRRQIVEPALLDVDELVRGLMGMLERLIPEDIQLVTSLTANPGVVTADRGQIEQVVLNLAVNARDAMPTGGRLVIETGLVDFDEAYCRRHVGARPGPQVMLAVSDTGVGMDARTQSRVFEPFFTTKEPGRGTVFKVYLPRTEGAVAEAPPVEEAAEPPGGTETILLVEDEAALRSLTRELLVSLGYRVLEAAHGREALELSGGHEGPIHLLVTDVILPRMNGREVAEQLVASRPDTRVLFVSGYTDDVTTRVGLADPHVVFLQKPFTLAALAHKVRQALAAPDAPDLSS